jgi:hypothetical protein
VRRAALLVVVAVLFAGCGSRKPDPYSQANSTLLNAVPVYPGAAAPKTTAGGNSSTKFGARDWTLPAHTNAEYVISWYVTRLQRAGWKIVGRRAGTLRAVRRGATLSVGVRGRTLEAIANSRG